jgi:DNA polymerase-3 subunit gamma/tau
VVNGGSLAPAVSEPEAAPQVTFANLAEIAALAQERREMNLQAFLYNNARGVNFAPGRIELNGGEYADAQTIQKLRSFLKDETGENWIISVSTDPGEPSLMEARENAQVALKQQMSDHPLVKSVLEVFPGSNITNIVDHTPTDADDA